MMLLIFFLRKFYDTDFNFKKYLYLFIFGHAVDLCCCEGFSLVAVHGLLIAAASLVAASGRQ